ncbi:DUF3782 domain-containing protein [Tepidimonas charontis]|uniref:DUF3782 domain-containing protein n=1 Tax=Tepidimonas charontis TaxID=2267262 RepID=A0A554X192_9BURK|nr:DUF3782 domain-containing protein [Tepidimonas charontis]TSE29593.1 hypothetical protein Tchar_02564 [Tepidimonas charontis]
MATTTEMSWDDIRALLAQLAEQSRETDRRMQETDRRMQETDRRMQETDRVVRQVSRQLGQLGNRLGQFVQDMVEPAVVRLFQEHGIPVHRVYSNATARDDSGSAIMEIDLLVINGDHAIAVECKSRLTTDDVDQHIERLKQFKACFTEHADKALLGAVAAMGAPEEVVRYAERQGLYVLVQADDDVVLRNQPGFEPKRW